MSQDLAMVREELEQEENKYAPFFVFSFILPLWLNNESYNVSSYTYTHPHTQAVYTFNVSISVTHTDLTHTFTHTRWVCVNTTQKWFSEQERHTCTNTNPKCSYSRCKKKKYLSTSEGALTYDPSKAKHILYGIQPKALNQMSSKG